MCHIGSVFFSQTRMSTSKSSLVSHISNIWRHVSADMKQCWSWNWYYTNCSLLYCHVFFLPVRFPLCLSFFRKASIFVSFLVDVALGMLLMSWLYRDNHITMLANTLVPAADVSVDRINCMAIFVCTSCAKTLGVRTFLESWRFWTVLIFIWVMKYNIIISISIAYPKIIRYLQYHQTFFLSKTSLGLDITVASKSMWLLQYDLVFCTTVYFLYFKNKNKMQVNPILSSLNLVMPLIHVPLVCVGTASLQKKTSN